MSPDKVQGCGNLSRVSEFVYALREPGGPFRYVGVTSDPKKRLAQHRARGTRSDQRGLRIWLDGLAGRGIKPDLAILYAVPHGENHEAAEREMISTLLGCGYDLVNGTGVTAGRKCGFCGEAGHTRTKCFEREQRDLVVESERAFRKWKLPPVAESGQARGDGA